MKTHYQILIVGGGTAGTMSSLIPQGVKGVKA